MSRYPRNVLAEHTRPLPALRFDINELADILRMSRAQLYKRIADGAIKIQKDGARTYVTLNEIERYVEARGKGATPPSTLTPAAVKDAALPICADVFTTTGIQIADLFQAAGAVDPFSLTASVTGSGARLHTRKNRESRSANGHERNYDQ